MLEDALDFSLRLRVAQQVAEGVGYTQLMTKFSMSFTQLKQYKDDPDFQLLVSELVEDNRQSAYYKLVSSARLAVDELVSFVGNAGVEPREELAAISLILSLTMNEKIKQGTASIKASNLKGYTRQNIETIKEAIIGKRPQS